MIKYKPQAHVEIVALILMNAVPIFGVIFFGWQPLKVVMFYWLETLVIGAMTVLRMFLIWPIKKLGFFQTLIMCFIFCFHFGLFCTVHGFFILSFLNQDSILPDYAVQEVLPNAMYIAIHLDLFLPMCSIFVVYGLMTIKDVAMKKLDSQNEEMMKPYKRIVIQQFAVLGFAFLSTQIPRTAFIMMLVMIAVKTIVDIHIWKKERKVEMKKMPMQNLDADHNLTGNIEK